MLTARAAQAAPFAYITNSNVVTVIDTATDTVIGNVPVGASADGVAVNATGTRVYVANMASGDVSVLDTASNSVIATVPVGGTPAGVAVNPAGTRVYVTNPSSDDVAVLDAATNTVITTVPIAEFPVGVRPYPWGVAVNPTGTRVYVANYTSGDFATHGTVSVLDAATNTVVDTVSVGGAPLGVVVTPDGTQVYVANHNSDTVSVLDVASNTVIATVPVGNGPHGVAVNPTGTRVYVANFFAGTVSTIDTSDPCDTAAVTTLFGGGNPLGVTVNPEGTRLYVAVVNAGAGVRVMDLATNEITGALLLGGSPTAFGVFIAPGVVPPVVPVPPAPIRVTGIEVTQGIQDLANSVPLVQVRRTFVRVHVVSDGAAVPGVTATLTGAGSYHTIGGFVTVPLEALVPVNTVGPRITVRPDPKRTNLDDSFLFELPWNWINFESLRFNAVLTADPGPPKHSCLSAVLDAPVHEFETLTSLSIQFVRLAYRLPATNALLTTSLAEQSQSESWIRRAYPLSIFVSTPDFSLFDAGLGLRVARVPLLCLSLPPDEQNLCAHRYITAQLVWLQVLTGFMGKADAAYGLIPQVPNDPASNFFTRGACCTNRIGAGPSSIASYAAHEMGHLLGRSHPVEGAAVCKHSADDASYPYFLSFIAPPLSDPATGLAGFDAGDASLLIPMSHRSPGSDRDIMGYCPPWWISDYTYKGLHSSLLSLHPSVGSAGLAGAADEAGPGPALPQVGDWLMVFGNIRPDLASAELLRAQRVDRVFEVPPRAPGSYSIRLMGTGGAMLADYPFVPDVIEDTAVVGDASSPLLGFGHVVPFVAGTREIQIVDASMADVVIGTRTVSPNPPIIRDVALEGEPDPITGALTLGWTASDPDGDPLTFDVFFTRDGGASLQPLMLNLSGTSVQIDPSRLGGGNAQFRVVATDGVQSASADSPPFILASKAPRPRILLPGDGTTIHLGQLVNLAGEATDSQDGVIPDTGLAWSTETGPLGTGPRISIADLAVGVNRITLAATNSVGLSDTTSILVTVEDNLDLPGPTLTAGPTQIGWHVAFEESQLQTAELDIGNSGSGDLEFTATSSAPWLSLSAASGTAPAALTLTADPRGFADGTVEEAQVTLAGVGIPGRVITVPATLSVGNTFVAGRPTTIRPCVPSSSCGVQGKTCDTIFDGCATQTCGPPCAAVTTSTTSTTSTTTSTSTSTPSTSVTTTSSTSSSTALSTSTSVTTSVPTTLPSTTTTVPCATPRCLVERALGSPECTATTVPDGVRKKLAHGLLLLENTERAPQKRAKTMSVAAKRLFRQASTVATKASRARHSKLSTACAATISRTVSVVVSEIRP